MTSSDRALDSADKGSEASDWTRHRVTDPQRESGIPPERVRHPAERTLVDESDEHVQLALADSTRTEANLGSLLRGLQHLAAGAAAARDANLALFHDLEKVRELLGKSNAEERVLRQRLRLLEQTLESEKEDSVRDRASFIVQEDSFLVELLNDHEKQIAELRARLGEALANGASNDALTPVSNPPSTLASIKLRTLKIPMPAPAGDPAEPPVAPPRPSAHLPLRQKADPTTRPLVEYSLGKNQVREERLDGPQLSDWPRVNR
ncbi:MAG TPA: hypothetical protein VF395_12665 [Polyangiaceae bacterium]